MWSVEVWKTWVLHAAAVVLTSQLYPPCEKRVLSGLSCHVSDNATGRALVAIVGGDKGRQLPDFKLTRLRHDVQQRRRHIGALELRLLQHNRNKKQFIHKLFPK
eukprot:365212-Chlamydomonas_euryale.AAC.2